MENPFCQKQKHSKSIKISILKQTFPEANKNIFMRHSEKWLSIISDYLISSICLCSSSCSPRTTQFCTNRLRIPYFIISIQTFCRISLKWRRWLTTDFQFSGKLLRTSAHRVRNKTSLKQSGKGSFINDVKLFWTSLFILQACTTYWPAEAFNPIPRSPKFDLLSLLLS